MDHNSVGVLLNLQFRREIS